jgi:hypothetical protein
VDVRTAPMSAISERLIVTRKDGSSESFVVSAKSDWVPQLNRSLKSRADDGSELLTETDRHSGTFEAFATHGLRQMLLLGNVENTLSGRNLLATDGTLHGYEGTRIDWNALWREAAMGIKDIPPYGARPYWTPNGPGGAPAPFSVLAFWGASVRLRIATDPATDRGTLTMLAGDQYLTGQPDPSAGDPDPRVQSAAAKRL